MPRKTSKPRKSKDENDLTSSQRRKLDALLAVSDAQSKAGLTYGPFDPVEGLLMSLTKARKLTRRVTLDIPVVLLDYIENEAKRLGMTARQLIVTILETHRFADRDQQLITLAIAQSTDQLKTGRYER